MQAFEQQLHDMVRIATEHRQRLREHLNTRMSEIERAWQQFGVIADRLVDSIIQPRMEALAHCFDNAVLRPARDNIRYHVTGEFRHTDQFPASATLEMAVSTDANAKTLRLLYDLRILPMLMPYEGHAEIAFAVNEVDDERVTNWFEEQIVQFVDTYLQLEHAKAYEKQGQVTDPVCGMTFQKACAAAQMEYRGHTYYFCVEDCQKRFANDPQRYLKRVVG